MAIFHAALYLFAFFSIWHGAGRIIAATAAFSTRLKVSSFALSFVVLGILTSIPEIAVGITSVAEHTPEIFVGDLIGGIPVIFLLIIPLLAIFGNGIQISHGLSHKNLFFSFLVMIIPTFFILDKTVTMFEGYCMIALYGVLFYLIQKHKGILDQSEHAILDVKRYTLQDILKIFLGLGIVLLSSYIIVEETVYFATLFHVSQFYIGLVLLALGTNLPEFSLAVRSVFSGKKDIAFGDYVGSGAANTLLFGIFTIVGRGEVITANSFLTIFFFLAVGLGGFFLFTLKKNTLSRNQGLVLLLIYLLFLVFENFHFLQN